MQISPALLLLLSAVAVNTARTPPHIHTQSPDRTVYFKPGQPIELPCLASGKPEPFYMWYRSGVEFRPSGQDARVVQLPGSGTLRFESPEDNDEGTYQCLANNGDGVSVSDKVELRPAKLAKFVYEYPQTHTAYLGDSLTLNCVPPVSYPPSRVSWVLRQANGTLQPVVLDQRVTMDLEGRLQFTNVQKSDEQNGLTYFCMATSDFLKSSVTGPENTVRVVGTTASKRPPQELWTSPGWRIVLKGDILRLQCIFSGNPTPNVTWTKIGATLPDRATVKSYGQELEITDIQLSDVGQYVCQGSSTEFPSSANKAFDIQVQASPYWQEQPLAVNKSVGDSATFTCEAGGIPEPIHHWFINGVAFADVRDPRFYKSPRVQHPNQTTLIISNLTWSDYVVIQCNATNRHGYLWSDFALGIKENRPSHIVG